MHRKIFGRSGSGLQRCSNMSGSSVKTKKEIQSLIVTGIVTGIVTDFFPRLVVLKNSLRRSYLA